MDVNSPLKIDNSILPQNEVQQSNQDVSLFRAIGSASPELNGPIDLKNQYNQMKKSAVATSFLDSFDSLDDKWISKKSKSFLSDEDEIFK